MTGPSGRASGWSNDVRKLEPYAAYDKVVFNEIVRNGGGTFDRYMARLDEIEESLKILEQLVEGLPEGEFRAKTKAVIRLPEGITSRESRTHAEILEYISAVKGTKTLTG